MNRIYRSLWNSALGAWVAAPETASTGGGAAMDTITGVGFGGSQVKLVKARVLSRCLLSMAVASALYAGLSTSALAQCVTQDTTLSCFDSSSNPGQEGQINGADYLNINKLDIESGIWNLTQPLFTGAVTNPVAQLNGGFLRVTSAGLGNAVLTAKGGSLGATANAATLNNDILFDTYGLIVNTDQGDLTLSGVLRPAGSLAEYGAGMLTKDGAGTLTLNGANTYIGGTNLMYGTLLLGNNAALGTGALSIMGGVNLDAATTNLVVSNAIALDANTLTLNGSHALTLNGTISGSGSLVKNGFATLRLGGNNTFSGGIRLNAGTLELTSDNALGMGSLTNAGGILLNTAPITLNNAVHLLGTLTVSGAESLSLNGVIDGTGNFAKTGTGRLVLNGHNSYSGNTFLLGGVTTVGSNTAFGSGSLTTGVASLESSTAVTLSNNITALGTLTFGGSGDLTLSGTVSGAGGSLQKTGAGTLTLSGNNNYQGSTVLSAGTLAVGQNNSLGTGVLTVNGASRLMAANNGLVLNNSIALNDNLTIDGANNLSLGGILAGAGSLTKAGSGTLTLNANNTFTGGVVLSGGALQLGNSDALGTGLLVARETATLISASYLDLSNDIRIDGDLTLNAAYSLISLQGHLSGSGNLIKSGFNNLDVSNINTFSGNIYLTQGTITTSTDNALGNPGNINLGIGTLMLLNGNQSIGALTGSGSLETGSGTIVTLGGSNLDNVFAGGLFGSGSFDKQGSGTLELTGHSDQLNNTTAINQVTAGTLKVTGTLGGSNSAGLNVGPGATLTGSGTITSTTTIASGGHLAGISGQTLTLASLNLSQNSNIDVALGSPLTGYVPLFNVNGPLTLDGVLNVTDAGGFGNGVYSLFNYGGNLIVNGATFGTTPNNLPAAYMALQTAIAGQVNLVVNSPDTTVQFWNGTQGTADGAIHGGSGLWDSTRTNWTSTDGNANRDWAGQFAVFMGTPGVVTVDGPQAVSGMQFMSDGYLLQPDVNGPLNTSNGNGAFFVVRTDPNVTATLSLPLTGSGHLNKMDTGTLVLNGDNSYAGGTTLSQGTLVLGHDNALGSGVLNTTAGTSLDSNTALTLANAMNVAGQLTLNGSNDLTLNGAISGAGQLTKNGNASLTLTGNNSYSGGTALNAGRLTLGHANALGTGELTITNYASQLDTLSAMTVANNVKLNGTLTVGGAHDLTLSGQVSGSASGSLAKEGDNTLTLNGDNSFGGGITLKQGTLRLGNANALGKGGLLVMGTGSLETSSAMALANNVSMILGSSALTLNVSHDLTLNGKLSASSGSLTKNGSGVLTLNHDNSAMTASMTVGEGSLVVNHILGSQDVRVNGNASLSGTGELTGAVTLANEANLNLRDGSLLKVGSLALDSGSNLNVALGTSLALAPALLKVANNLTLAGKLNVTDLGGFGAGTYRLIDYGGSLNNQGLMVNTLPNGLIAADVQVQTAIDKQINLVVGGPGNIAFWNGSQQAPNGSITGGEGLWNATNTNWTDANGKFGQAWSDTFAVFSGNAGTVVVNGMQTISGMQFTTNGYTIKGWAGGRLISTGAGNIRVDRDVSAILDVAILGSGSMIKLDAGKLVLSGTNFYTGVTDIREGILQVGNGGTTGSLGGGAVSNAG